MWSGLALVSLLVVGGLAAPARETPTHHNSFDKYVKMLHLINSSPELTAEWNRHVLMNREPTPDRRFWSQKLSLQCPGQFQSSSKPTSVHKLLVGDIDVIGALGDSLTAGNGVLAGNIFGCLTEYRGRSWSVGGDRSYADGITTLANILKVFNPNLVGWSTGSGDENSSGANFNAAVAGAIAQDMPDQARNLVDKMRRSSEVDFQNDWKLVTLFIGGNNLCDYCNDLNKHSAEEYIANIAEALDILRDEMPRTLVNLVEIFDIAPIAGLGNGFICSLVHSSVCGCGHGANADKEMLSSLSREYQQAVRQLIDRGRYDGKDDFTVVVQPFFRETAPPSKSNGEPDMTYFAPDCFHFSSKGQNTAGKALWNNMLQPLRSKQTDWDLDSPVNCPAETYIPTRGSTY